MKKFIRIFLTALLTLVFLFSTGRFLLDQREKAMGSSIYQDALTLASSEKPAAPQPQSPTVPQTPGPAAQPQWVVDAPEDDPHIQDMESIDLEALREVNPDVLGWIMIPDTVIHYPLMAGTEDNYYLNHTWNKESYGVGSIFLEHLSSPDFTAFNTIVYGHNMNDGSMFGSLLQYRDPEFRETHPYVYIRSDQDVYRYEIFSAYFAKIDSDTYGVQFSSENTKNRFLDQIIGNSVIDTGIRPEITDRVLTLSTCSGRGASTRWVVHARLKMVQQTSQ